MAKIRDLPEIMVLTDDDLLYVVDTTAGPNGGRKITRINLKSALSLSPLEVKTLYESNADTNEFSDAEKAKLATVGINAAFQIAIQVPYSNALSGLSATDVQNAIDQVNTKAQADFRSAIVANRILAYSGGTARFDGVFFSILGSDILLNGNVTDGYVYVDLDGVVKQTGSGVLPPPYTVVFAKFSTDANDITALEDQRVKNSQNLIRGLVSDIAGIHAGDTNFEGASGRVADAAHRHFVSTGVVIGQTPDQANAVGTDTHLARADHVHNIPTGVPSGSDALSTNVQGSAAAFSRQDHIHAISTGIVIGQTPDQANATGTGANIARADHVHNIPTGVPSLLNATQSNTQGTAAAFARQDHLHAISTGIVIGQTPDQSNAAGSSANLARADHVHNIPTAAAVDVGPTNSQGSAATFSRADHTHRGLRTIKANAGTPRFNDVSLVSGIGVAVVDDGSGNFTIDTTIGPNELFVTQGVGLIANYTAGRVRINGTTYTLPASFITVAINAANGRIYVDVDGVVKSTTSTTAPPNTVPLAIFSSNVSNLTALSDTRFLLNSNVQFGLAGDIAMLVPDAAAAPGTTNKYADAGHVHNVPTAAAINLSATTTNTQGSASTFARSDHTHSISSGIVIGQTPDQSNAIGTSANFARADHVHNIPTGVPSLLNATQSNTQGTAAAFARQDHLHAISTAAAITQTPDQANATGTSANLARADHVHAIATAAAVSLSTTGVNAQGASTSFARADHTHAVSVASQEATATADDTTASTTDVLINSMTQTPGAGTYFVMFTGSAVNSANGAERTFVSLYANGTQVTATERSAGVSGGTYSPFATQAVITVAAAQAIEVRWRVAAGTSTMHSRRLTLLRIA